MRGALRIATTLAVLVASSRPNAAEPRATASKAPAGMVLVGPGTYEPLYPASPGEREVRVDAFYLGVTPVTNGEFLTFVRAHPEWRRDRVKALLADRAYLSHWVGPDVIDAGAPATNPVTRVSWFAARAYCSARGERLPSEREWELAALASESRHDGRDDPAWTQRILTWYGEPAGSTALPEVGRGKANAWGVHDLHGVVWEWVADFGASLVSTDGREKGKVDRMKFCGGAGADARDPTDYAAFMRVAFRSSLKARYTTHSLGFRCARSRVATP